MRKGYRDLRRNCARQASSSAEHTIHGSKQMGSSPFCVIVIAAVRSDPEVTLAEIDVVSELAKVQELASCVQY